jgi:hypothetical protein
MAMIGGERMELESALLWFSRISLVFWIGILTWCGVTIATKHQKEKKWLSQYVPTLQSHIRETEIKSWVTLSEFERLREKLSQRVVSARGTRKG